MYDVVMSGLQRKSSLVDHLPVPYVLGTLLPLLHLVDQVP